jgi:hypothetical protein
MATKPKLIEEPVDFSLVLGGPTFQLLRRAHLEGSHLELLYRRLIVITLFAWMPLLLLATFGSLTGSAGRFSFFHDVEVHVRFLVALPILIVRFRGYGYGDEWEVLRNGRSIFVTTSFSSAL